MSDFRSLGGVSATLQTLLKDRMELTDGNSTVLVTIGPPVFSGKDNDPHPEDERVNLFLYRVTENGYLQNQEIPGRDSRGAYGHPPLSLNLHYLVSGYGNLAIPGEATLFDETRAQVLLGSAMRVLHDTPIITDSLQTVRPPSGRFVLDESLRDEYENLKITLEPLTLDDITKVWSSLALRFRLSAAYVVDLVQIESQRPRTFPRPVGQPASAHMPLPSDPATPGPMVYVLTIQTPTITDVRLRRAGEANESPFPYARIGDTLVLRGTSLVGPVTEVSIGDLRIPASFASGDRVEADIPNTSLPNGDAIPSELQIQPGVRTVRVVTSDPLTPHSVATSNDAAFMLVPGVNMLTYAAGPPRTLGIDGTRLVREGASCETIVGRSVVRGGDYTTSTPTRIVLAIPDALPARDVRVLISGTLGDTVSLGIGPKTLEVTIGVDTPPSVTAGWPSSIPLTDIPALLKALIHDVAARAPLHPERFRGTLVSLWDHQLVVVPGGLADAISFASPAGSTFAGDLRLTSAQPPGAGSALLSGEIASPPVLSSSNPRVILKIGAQPEITVDVARATLLADLAQALQAAIRAAAGGLPEYASALVIPIDNRLLVVPGAAGTVAFKAVPGDEATVVELKLHANFAVRVRVNGAESIDTALVELPQ